MKFKGIIGVFLLIIGILFTACTASLTGNAPKQNNAIIGHRYVLVSNIEEIKGIKHMSTYVLLPEKPTRDKVKERYKLVLALIQGSLGIDSNSAEAKSSQYNKFLIMDNNPKERATVDNYNYRLSQQMINSIKENTKEKEKVRSFFVGEGPFFVTTVDSSLYGTRHFQYLFLDLSGFDNSGINQVIKDYKQRLKIRGIDEFTILERMKRSVLSFSMHANDDISAFVEIFGTTLNAAE